MAFDGLKKIFDILGGATIDSSKKVGEGVQVPVSKLNDMRAKSRSGLGSRSLGSRGLGSLNKESPRVIERMKMDKDEIQMFKELIDKKYERADKPKEDKAQRDAYQKASLEELLKEEEKEGIDPKLIMGMGAVSFVLILVIMTVLGFGIEIGLVFGMLIFLMSVMIIFLPKMQKGKKSNEASRELPYALRQMATELRAGLGLHESMRSVALSGYGPLSEEFARTLEEIKYGETTENALMDMSERIDSDGMKRAVHQITRTLASGGDLSRTLNVIAEDVAYEMRMKLKDYAQKLNSFTMIYMFVAILGPVILMIMLIAASTVMGGSMFPPVVLLILYLFLFPLIVGFLAFMIKRLEPQI
ncbi:MULTISPECIES: type II secretion system F family protein [Methanobacterium]|jgi:flagellar protein FlaJ|uniref:Type II secretion system F family protein n=1 Tax=Methanobacterium veterum TaxID=408577 RepID=A0A9E4ZWE8_9EURY|nr:MULTISPECIES: type II secretion system F family protein [Methanobacterium]MCZ3366436.1 type II secretion system F family protein [Methanobacterium veterum]MCZ3371944.1 type II secretion system F family protein [Methanobacterium veterum]